jgi:hypothetical protein
VGHYNNPHRSSEENDDIASFNSIGKEDRCRRSNSADIYSVPNVKHKQSSSPNESDQQVVSSVSTSTRECYSPLPLPAILDVDVAEPPLDHELVK